MKLITDRGARSGWFGGCGLKPTPAGLHNQGKINETNH